MAGNATARGVPRRILQGEMSVPVIGAGQIPTITYSSGAARALQQFGQNLFNLSAGFEDQLDREAEAEASTRGTIDGAAGDFTFFVGIFEAQNKGTPCLLGDEKRKQRGAYTANVQKTSWAWGKTSTNFCHRAIVTD